MTKLGKKLKTADSEKRVEAIYHQELERALKAAGVEVLEIKTSVKTDGIIDTNFQFKGKTIAMKIIVEVKQDETFSSATVRSKVLAQVIFYLKRLEDNGKEIPHIVFVGDKDECFIVHTNYLVDYLKKDYDWSKAPSQAHINNPDLVLELAKDDKLQEQCYVYSVEEGFKLEEVVEKMKGLTVGTPVKVRVTEKNIAKIFEYFTMNVLSRKSNGQARYNPREQVELFMTIVNERNDCYAHPNKPGKAVFKGKEVDVKRDAFNQFKNHYEFNYTVEEKKEFTAIADRLIEDSERRMKGDFYTQQIWVDEAHKMLAENLGDNWKEEYMVWDCAAGTMNLTRDYTFKELYSSTLHEHDLVISEKYNPWSVKFQYDFLNDDVEIMDELLKKVENGHKLTTKDFYGTKLWQKAQDLITGLLLGKKLLFFINPPYGRGSELSQMAGGNREAKKGIQKSKINDIMLRNKIGASSANLYAQFMFRVKLFADMFKGEVSLGLFSPTAFMTGESFKGLREALFGETFKYVDGMMFQASQFADVSDNWGISFTILKSTRVDKEVPEQFKIKLKENTISGVSTIRIKRLYNLDNKQSGIEYARSLEKSEKIEYPVMSSGLKVKQDTMLVDEDFIGQLGVNTNIVEKNSMGCSILSSKFKGWAFIDIKQENLMRAVSYFAARKLLRGNFADWANSKDEYMWPNTEHELYGQWEKDSLVYSLFNTSSNQTSLRNVEVKGTEWNIYNHFFFMSRDEILQLATNPEHINNAVEQDIYDHGKEERYVYTKIKEIEDQKGFSPDAQAVLDKARELVKSSFKYRDLFNMEKPEYHINTWDAGWYQIKGLLKEYDPKGLKEFTELYKEFEDRMRPLVYELGFLYE